MEIKKSMNLEAYTGGGGNIQNQSYPWFPWVVSVPGKKKQPTPRLVPLREASTLETACFLSLTKSVYKVIIFEAQSYTNIFISSPIYETVPPLLPIFFSPSLPPNFYSVLSPLLLFPPTSILYGHPSFYSSQLLFCTVFPPSLLSNFYSVRSPLLLFFPTSILYCLPSFSSFQLLFCTVFPPSLLYCLSSFSSSPPFICTFSSSCNLCSIPSPLLLILPVPISVLLLLICIYLFPSFYLSNPYLVPFPSISHNLCTSSHLPFLNLFSSFSSSQHLFLYLSSLLLFFQTFIFSSFLLFYF